MKKQTIFLTLCLTLSTQSIEGRMLKAHETIETHDVPLDLKEFHDFSRLKSDRYGVGEKKGGGSDPYDLVEQAHLRTIREEKNPMYKTPAEADPVKIGTGDDQQEVFSLGKILEDKPTLDPMFIAPSVEQKPDEGSTLSQQFEAFLEILNPHSVTQVHEADPALLETIIKEKDEPLGHTDSTEKNQYSAPVDPVKTDQLDHEPKEIPHTQSKDTLDTIDFVTLPSSHSTTPEEEKISAHRTPAEADPVKISTGDDQQEVFFLGEILEHKPTPEPFSIAPSVEQKPSEREIEPFKGDLFQSEASSDKLSRLLESLYTTIHDQSASPQICVEKTRKLLVGLLAEIKTPKEFFEFYEMLQDKKNSGLYDSERADIEFIKKEGHTKSTIRLPFAKGGEGITMTMVADKHNNESKKISVCAQENAVLNSISAQFDLKDRVKIKEYASCIQKVVINPLEEQISDCLGTNFKDMSTTLTAQSEKKPSEYAIEKECTIDENDNKIKETTIKSQGQKDETYLKIKDKNGKLIYATPKKNVRHYAQKRVDTEQ